MNSYDVRTLIDSLDEARIYAGAEFERLCFNNQYIEACIFQSIRDSIAQNIQLLQSYIVCKAEIGGVGRGLMLEKAKEIIKKYYNDANCGIFDSRNTVRDVMETIYEDEDLTIDICYKWAYFEVFGLSSAEFKELEKYYYSLRESEE